MWKRIAQVVGDFVARVLLTAFYFTLFAPFALIVRLRHDPLAIKHVPDARWLARPASDETLEGARKQA